MRLVFSLFLVAAMAVFDLAQTQTKRPIAAIKNVVGIVKLQRSDTRQKIVATAGNLLYSGDGLTTGSEASVAVLFTDGSMLKVQENSEATLKAERKGERKLDASVDLPLGEIWAKVTRRDTRFEIETPSSVASVKGTEFSVKVDELGTSTVFVFEGLIQFQNELGEVMVKRNQKSTARANQAPDKPQNLSKKEIKQREETGPNWKLEIKTPSGNQAPNQSFQLQLKAQNPETNRVDLNCNSNVVISSTTSGAQFSIDGNTWANELEAQLASGALSLYAKGRTDKDLIINAAGNNCQPGRTTVTIVKTRQQKMRESEKVRSVVNKIGISEVEGLKYTGGELKTGTGDIDEILSRIDNGDLEVVSYEVVESPDGKKKITLRVKPAASKGGGPGTQ